MLAKYKKIYEKEEWSNTPIVIVKNGANTYIMLSGLLCSNANAVNLWEWNFRTGFTNFNLFADINLLREFWLTREFGCHYDCVNRGMTVFSKLSWFWQLRALKSNWNRSGLCLGHSHIFGIHFFWLPQTFYYFLKWLFKELISHIFHHFDQVFWPSHMHVFFT